LKPGILWSNFNLYQNTKQFWVRLVFEAADVPQVKGVILGIDRGLYHQAVTSDGQFSVHPKSEVYKDVTYTIVVSSNKKALVALNVV